MSSNVAAKLLPAQDRSRLLSGHRNTRGLPTPGRPSAHTGNRRSGSRGSWACPYGRFAEVSRDRGYLAAIASLPLTDVGSLS
jgi:hypothetical protein